MKNNTLTLNDFSHKIYFYYWKKLKKHVFSPKLAWPPATYDIISCNHSNWPPLHLSQNVYKGWMNSYWKCQVLMFYPLGKNSEKPYRGGIHTPPPPVRPRVNILNVGYSQAHEVKVSSWELFQNMGREANDNKHYSTLCCHFLQTCPGCKKTKLHWLHTQPRLKAIQVNDTFRTTL